MTERTRITSSLLNLINDFEHGLEKGMTSPLDAKSYFRIISYYEGENRVHKVLDVINKAIAQFPYNADLIKEKSRFLLKVGKYDEAHEALDQAEILAPFKVDLLLLRAVLLAYEENFDDAHKIINDVKSYAKHEDEIRVLIAEAEVAELAGEHESMFQALKTVLVLDPKNEYALELIKSAVDQGKHFEESILIYRVILESHPYCAQAWYNLGHSFARVTEYDNAIEALEYAFLVDSDFEDAYYDCAEFCIDQKEYYRAEIILNEAVCKFEIINYDALHNLAYCQYKLGKIEESKRSLFKAMQLEPYCEQLRFLLAKCFIKDKDWVNAIKMLETAIDLEDQNEEYYFYLARIYEWTDKLSKANAFYRKAALCGEEQSYYWEEYILFLMRNDNLDIAEKYIKISSQHTYSSKIAYIEIASKLLKGERSTGLKLLADLIQEDFDGKKTLLDIDERIKMDKDVISIINYYEKEKE